MRISLSLNQLSQSAWCFTVKHKRLAVGSMAIAALTALGACFYYYKTRIRSTLPSVKLTPPPAANGWGYTLLPTDIRRIIHLYLTPEAVVALADASKTTRLAVAQINMHTKSPFLVHVSIS